MKKLYLVDVSSMFFRAFFAIPHLSNKSGLPTNALYGFLTMTVKLLREIKPDYMAFCFDRKEPSFRLEMYPEYKANRTEMPEDLVPQIPYVHKLTELLGIPKLDLSGYEADDVIGTLTRYGREQGLEVIIVSGDKDFAQLVAPCVSMYDTMKEIRYDQEGVVAKWGVQPEQMIDYLALVGDSSDNIPGVRGIGPKGAQKLLKEYKTLDGIYEHLDEISGKAMKAKLADNKEMAYLSKKLVTIVNDAPVDVSLESLRLKEIDRDKVHEILAELEFKTMERNLFGQAPLQGKSKAKSKGKTSGAPSSSATSVSVSGDFSAAVPEKIDDVSWSLEQLDKNVAPYSEIWGFLTERALFFAMQDKVIKVEADPNEIGKVLGKKLLKWKGFDLKELWKHLNVTDPVAEWDQMLAAYVVRPGNIDTFDSVYQKYCGDNLPDLASLTQIYSAHLQLEACLREHLKSVDGQKVLEKIELPLVPVLFSMERHGIRIDVDQLKSESQKLEEDLHRIEQEIFKECGESFNVASPKQLGHVLFEKMGLPPGKKTKTGYSTSSDVLEKLAPAYPVASRILEWRELSKLKSTYVDALPQLVHQSDGKIHSNFRQAATTTGRLSSVNPNLQNIPIRTERGRLIRKAFVSEKGTQFIAADYSQIELRVLAHITEDKGLVSAFENDLDIHTATASEIFGVKLDEVTSDLRRTAKAVNFGIAYGQGAFGLSETLGISRGEASDIIQRYFERFKNVKEYMESVVEQAKRDGYVETLFGRRRYIDELKSRNGNIRKFGERAAINAPIQGTASDLVKKAMITAGEDIAIPMLLQVHDELLFECPIDEVEEESARIKKLMESVAQLKVPLKVNVASGASWEDAHS